LNSGTVYIHIQVRLDTASAKDAIPSA